MESDRYSPRSRSSPFGARDGSVSGPDDRSRTCPGCACPAPGAPPRLCARLAVLRALRLDRIERRDARFSPRFELCFQRRPVVGDRPGPVARATELDIEALLCGEVGVVRLHPRDHVVDSAAPERVLGRGPDVVEMAKLRVAAGQVQLATVRISPSLSPRT